MPGEPSWFSITRLRSFEGTPSGSNHQSNIIDQNENFFLRATVHGDPSVTEWYNMKHSGIKYRLRFFAKSMTPNVGDSDFGYTAWTDLSQDDFTVDSPTVKINITGLFECGCWIEFQNALGTQYYGVLGYNREWAILVHPIETPP
jgi:hypothetical protein